MIEQNSLSISIKESDLKVEWYSGTGAGGQYRNKHQNSCRMTHIPTGVVVTSQCRSRNNSYAEAFAAIEQRVLFSSKKSFDQEVASERKKQVGSGMRGDKIRTYRFQDDIVQDHVSGKSANCTKVLKGHFNLLWS